MHRSQSRFMLVAVGLGLAGLVLATGVATAAAADMQVVWKNGLSFSTEDKKTQIKIGGRIHQDWAVLTGDDELQDQLGTLEDGTEFRRSRLAISGIVDDIIEFKTQYDFTKGEVAFKDVYLGLLQTPLLGAGLRAGHFYQPMGLEELTSSNYIQVMERSFTSYFVPSRKSGMMLHNSIGDGRGTWAISAYRSSDSVGKDTGDAEWNFAGRATTVVWKGPDGNDLVHLGVSATRRKVKEKVLEIKLQPEAHLLPRYSKLKAPANSWTVVGGEAALVKGPISVQAEGMAAMTVAPEGAEDGTFTAFYALVGWFITGESIPYKEGSAKFDRVKPKKNYGTDGGMGAVQLVARVSHLDLQDGMLDAGTLAAVTLGMNWHLNPNSRVMVNYVRSDGDAPDAAGVSHAFQTRFQVNF